MVKRDEYVSVVQISMSPRGLRRQSPGCCGGKAEVQLGRCTHPARLGGSHRARSLSLSPTCLQYAGRPNCKYPGDENRRESVAGGLSLAPSDSIEIRVRLRHTHSPVRSRDSYRCHQFLNKNFNAPNLVSQTHTQHKSYLLPMAPDF